MKAALWSWLVVGVVLGAVVPASAQPPVGALAVDERQGDQYGWAVDYETAGAAQAAALGECGSDCSVVLTFERCGAYAADQTADIRAVGWAESFAAADRARRVALSECASRGGSACIVRVWGCNGQVVEEGLGFGVAVRRQIQEGLRAAGFDPGGVDGVFGPRTRAAIRDWQASRGVRATGYLDAASAAALRSAAPGLGPAAVPPPARAAQQPPASSEVELVFWQSIANSTNPAELEAYLRRFPSGMFSELAQIRLEALRSAVGSPASGSRRAAGNSGAGPAAGVDARGRPGAVFRAGPTCAGQPPGTSCWMEVSGRSGCYVWNPGLELGATVTWAGECVAGYAQGTATLTWVWDGNRRTDTGRLVDGEQHGHWVERLVNGQVQEGPYVAGERNGQWIVRALDGRVEAGLLVDGERHGDWVLRDADGDVLARGRYVDGQLVERR